MKKTKLFFTIIHPCTTLCFILLLLTSLQCYSQAVVLPSSQLIPNGDFEQTRTAKYAASEGIYYDASGAYVTDWWSDEYGIGMPGWYTDNTSPAGSHYVRLESKNTWPYGPDDFYVHLCVPGYACTRGQEMFNENMTVVSGKTYTLYFWVRNAYPTPLSNYFIYLSNSQEINADREGFSHGPQAGSQQIYAGSNLVNSSWTLKHATFTAQDNYKQLWIGAYETTSNTTYLDIDGIYLYDEYASPYVTSSKSPCLGGTTVLTAYGDGASYNWVAPQGWTFANNNSSTLQNGPSQVTLIAPSSTSSTVSSTCTVTVTDNNGTIVSAPGTINIQAYPTTVATPIITGPTSICGNAVNQSYSLMGIDQPATWSWAQNGATFVSGNVGNPISINTANNFSVNPNTTIGLSVYGANGCGARSGVASLYVYLSSTVPPTPSVAPAGPYGVNNNVPASYSLAAATANVFYTVTPAAAVASSSTSAYGQININWNPSFTGGATITAKILNGCGWSGVSPARSVQVSNPSVVYGPSNVCSGPGSTQAYYQGNVSTTNVAFDIEPASAVQSSAINQYAAGNIAVTWTPNYSGPAYIRVSINGGPWSPTKTVAVSNSPSCSISGYSRDGVEEEVSTNPGDFYASLYPNPSESGTTLVVNGASGITNVEISDVTGRVVQSNNLDLRTNATIGESLQPGIYNVKVTYQGITKVLKFVKSN